MINKIDQIETHEQLTFKNNNTYNLTRKRLSFTSLHRQFKIYMTQQIEIEYMGRATK